MIFQFQKNKLQAVDNSIVKLFFAFIAIIFFNQCQKAPINGDLDGQWEVIEVNPKPEDTIIEERLFYNFSRHVCQLVYYEGYFLTGNMNFDGDNLWIEFPGKLNEREKKILRQYGIDGNPVVFEIESLNKKRLKMRDGEITVSLIKF